MTDSGSASPQQPSSLEKERKMREQSPVEVGARRLSCWRIEKKKKRRVLGGARSLHFTEE